jgi:quinol monooxygenase YgiN
VSGSPVRTWSTTCSASRSNSSAPLQRILYQLYADRSAYDRHQERPYVADFESRRRPLVLATNVIELGVRQAKVAAVTPPRVP